jgi:hypothetical protein
MLKSKVFSIVTQHGRVVMLTKENLTEVLKLPDEVRVYIPPRLANTECLQRSSIW